MGLLTGRAGQAVFAAGTGTDTMKMAGQWNDTALTSGLRFAAHFTRDNSSYREQKREGAHARTPDQSNDWRSGTGDQGEAVECFRTKRANRSLCPPATARNKDEVMNYLEKGSTSHEHPDSAYHMPGTELRSPAHRHRSTGEHLAHLLDHESPPDPRRLPESSRPVAGGSSCISRERPSRLSAALSRAGSVACYAAGFLLAVAALFALPLQAQAQTVQTLVSNTGAGGSSSLSVGVTGSDKWSMALGFTTGDADGYPLSSVQADVDLEASAQLQVSIYQADASGNPGSSLYVLDNPSPIVNDVLNTFAAPANATLDPGTKYFVVFEAPTGSVGVRVTNSHAEDSDKANGWSISDGRHVRSSDAGSWSQHSSASKPKIAVMGTIDEPTTTSTDATLSALTVNDGTTDHTIDLASTSYTLDVGNAVTTVTLTATPTHTGASVSAVTLGGTVIADADFTDGITVPSLLVGDNTIVVTVTAEDGSTQPYTVTVTRAGAGITVTIEAEHESIGGGVEDLKFTLTRTGATTDALTVTVTLTQDQNWLTSTYLTHEVEFAAGEATKELIIEDDDFSFDPTTSGNLVATVTGTGVAGGTDTVVVISIADPPITIAFDQDAYIFPEGGPADDVEIYVTATLDAAFTRKPSSNFYVAIATEEGTATGPEDYVFVSRTPSFKPTDFTANSVGQQVASLLFGPSTGNRRLVIVDDNVYEVDETFNVQIEFTASVRFGLVRVKKADGTFCVLSTSCGEIPYPVTITDDDLPTLSLAAAPTSIAEEDNSTTTVTVENVSTVTVEITNGKTFAEDQTVTLTFSGDATQGTHYSVSPGDTDTNATGHQVVLVKETASVEVTVTATGNDTDDGNRTVTVAADLEGTAIGSTDITILDDDTTTPNTPPTVATAIPDQSATVGTAFSYAFPATTFTDAESDPLTYTATKADGTPLPAWLSFNESTRAFSGTPPAAGTVSVKVTASDGAGSVSDTFDITVQPVPTTVPGYPTGLTATADGTSTIDLDWDAPSDDGGAAITGYRIEVSPNGTSSSWSDLVANTNSTSTSYSHTGLSAGTTRHYRVSAINSVGTGAASRTANATTTTVPGYPTGLTATADGTSTIDLDWDAPSDDGGAAITGYRIEVSPNGTSSSWSDLVANTNSTSTSYSHTGLSAGTTRHYRVSAINSVGTGAASRTANATTDDAATTVPDAPTGLSATADGTSTIDLDWTAPSDDGGASITGYRIEVSPNGTSSSWSDLVANTNSTSTSYSHTGLSAGTTRHYRVSAINSVGTGAASRTANATTDDAATTVPDAPTGLSATADGTSTIDLDWTAPADNGGTSITGYKIEVSSNGGTSWTNRVANTTSTSTTYAHTGLAPGTTRHYRVSAINATGTGAASNTDNATTEEDAPTVPDAPTGLSATADGTSTIDLDWTAPADNGGTSITGYKIEVSSNGGTSWTNRVANTTSTSTTYAHTGLAPGTTRHYRVSAINATGTGAASNTDNATTEEDDEPELAVVTVHALAPSVSVGGTARFELRRSGGDMGWLKVSYRHDESSDGNYVKSWGYFKPGVTRKGADYDVGRSPGTVTARVTGPSHPLCTEDNDPSDSCTDNYMVGNPSSASMQVTASASSSAAAAAADDALEDALTLVDDLTPDVAAAVLLGEQTLGEAELAALDRLGNGNGRYDLGDLLSWIDRCRRGEARCGPTSTGSGPPSAAGLLAAAAAGRPWRRTRRRGSGRPGRKSIRAARRRGRFAGYALATLLAVTMTLSCTEGSVGPAANVQDPGFLTVEWTGPAAGRGIGVLLELEGPGIEAVRAPGFELYESRASGRHEIVVAGSLRAGPLVQFRVPDRGQLPLYRVRVLEVAGEDYELRDAGQYRAVITLH